MDSIHNGGALETRCARLRLDPHHMRQLRNAFYKKKLSSGESLESIPEPQRGEFADGLVFHSLELHSRRDSQVDGASKLIFRTAEGRLIETVILRIASG